MRVLLLAEACNPTWPSTPLQGYLWYRHLRELVDVTLVTQVRNRPGFEEAHEKTDAIHFLDTERVASPLNRLCNAVLGGRSGMSLGSAMALPACYYFEWLIWKRFGRDLRLGRYDVVHRLTPASPVVPSWMASRCPVPFLIGPLNGSLPWPSGTRSILHKEGEWLASLRSIQKCLPGWRSTYGRASFIILAARHVRGGIPRSAQRRTVIHAENGVDTDHFSPASSWPPPTREPFRILFVGRQVPFKQPGLILDALATKDRFRQGVEMVYVGDGPERDAIRTKAEELGLTHCLRMVPNVPHDQLPSHYRSASVLVLPSIHESGGAVLLEAMSCGLPCIVVDYGGPGEYITPETGFKVPLGSYGDMVRDTATAIETLMDDPELHGRLAIASRRHIEAVYAWPAKARWMTGLYRQAALADRR